MIKFQSAYRQKHSTETALTRVQNEIIKLTAKKQDLIEIYKPTRTLRSSASISLKTPIPPNSFVGRAFSFNAPKIWNNLYNRTRSCTSLQSLKKCLKKVLFYIVFENIFLLCCTVSIIL